MCIKSNNFIRLIFMSTDALELGRVSGGVTCVIAPESDVTYMVFSSPALQIAPSSFSYSNGVMGLGMALWQAVSWCCGWRGRCD